MEKITIHIRPIDWEQGDVYGISMRLSGESPAVKLLLQVSRSPRKYDEILKKKKVETTS